ncbi:MAG: CvpA family protein, partial [Ruminococcus sp.]|nr:CvpA family protein [Ruminococcus sp.]
MILDIIFLAVIIIFIISGAIRGFARAIMNIAAVVASAILSNLLSGVISDWIFNSFVRNDLIANLNNAVTNTEISVNSALGDLPGWVSSVVSFFCNLFNFDEQRLVDCFVGTASTAKLSAVQV